MKSSHNTEPSSFRPSFPTSGESEGFATSSAGAISSEQFSLSPEVWTALLKDPDVARQWEQRVAEGVAQETQQAEADARTKGQAEGFEAGRVEGRKEAEASIQRLKDQLETTLGLILKEKHTVLNAHSEEFCKVLDHLMTRFLVPEPELKVRAVERWLESIANELPREGWTLRVDTAAYSALAADWGLLQSKYECRLVSDESLAPGDLSFHFGTGEMIFNREAQLAQLQSLLHPKAPDTL